MDSIIGHYIKLSSTSQLKKEMSFNNQNHLSICILLATYNGGQFLAEQLDSISEQTHTNWRVVLSDDGSTDNTLEIAKAYQKKWGANRLEIRGGPSAGYCTNFLTMACDEKIQADFYAFCDQDDVWYPEKLTTAIIKLNAIKNTKLASVYCGRTEIVSESLDFIGYSQLFKAQLSFRNALVQSIAGGNTMVINHATKVLLQQTGLQDVVSHDWWVYKLVSGVGGHVYYDQNPMIKYRQHGSSLVGENLSVSSKLLRLKQGLDNRFKDWNDKNGAALFKVMRAFSATNQKTLEQFQAARNSETFWGRLIGCIHSGLYRQTKVDTMKLWVGFLFNKI